MAHPVVRSGFPPPLLLGSLEIGRFIAASMVLLSHFMLDVAHHARSPDIHILGGVLPPAPIAVQYFFVLSGFVMMSAHHRDFGRPIKALHFWWRRAARIYPLYWLALLVPCIFLYHSLTPHWLAQLVFLFPIRVIDLVPPAWSLRYEIVFYLIFGFGLLPYVGKPVLAVWVLGLIWGCWYYLPWGLSHLLPLPVFPHAWADSLPGQAFDPHAFYFFAGLGGGWIFARFRLPPWLCWGLLAAGMMALVAQLPHIFWGYGYGHPFMQAGTGLAFAAMMLGLGGFERYGRLRFGPWARRLGAVSYPLYILHPPLLLLTWRFAGDFRLGQAGLYGMLLLGLSGLYGAAWLAAFGLDQPLQRALRRWGPVRPAIRGNARI